MGRKFAGLVALSACVAAASPAAAKEVVVQMLNKGEAGLMVFEPAYVSAAVGDTVKFVPTNPGHNSEPIDGMLPAGVTLPKGKFNQEYTVKLTKPGLYGFKCLPHYGMGMVALVKAGNGTPANLAAVKAVKLPPLANKRFAPLIAQAQ
jgi:pseudoazurin